MNNNDLQLSKLINRFQDLLLKKDQKELAEYAKTVTPQINP